MCPWKPEMKTREKLKNDFESTLLGIIREMARKTSTNFRLLNENMTYVGAI